MVKENCPSIGLGGGKKMISLGAQTERTKGELSTAATSGHVPKQGEVDQQIGIGIVNKKHGT